MGRFTLAEELGAGGMATVYLGKMRLGAGLDRLVALKTIHGHLAKKQAFVDMFLDEARIASNISHPNVCSVYDFGEEEGVYYLAMEHLLGEPLFDMIGAIDRDRGEELMQAVPFLAARVIADAAEGLHAAHTTKSSDGSALGIIHRDVSPQNIFVTYEGTVKIVDFGCAKALERVTQTNTGVMKGKVSYAAPEQLRAGELDQRVDVFALGVCLWEMLAVRPLFRRGSAIETARAVLEEETPRADADRPWVPRALADIAAKALATDADDRFESARDLGRELRNWIAKSGVPFESAEVAEWMDYLFADRHAERRAVVRKVEGIDGSAVAKVSVDDDSLLKAVTAVDPDADQGSQPRTLRFDVEDERRRAPRKKKGRAGLIVLVALLLAGGGAAAWALTQDRGPEPEVPVAVATPEPEVVDESEGYTGVDMVFEPDDVTVEPLAEEPGDEEATEPTGEAEAPARQPMSSRRRAPASSRMQPSSALTEAEEVARAGALAVRATGGFARVVYEGNDLGRTPVRFDLPPGRHTIRVLPNGEEPGQTFQVRIEAGTLKTINVQIPNDEPRAAPTPTPPADDPEDSWTDPADLPPM
tara:strand:- start:2404 stop:4167 length:1764 start_codon:yes stop_codon:yes gene_type:complete